MRIAFRCDEETVWLEAPDTATVYASRYPAPNASADTLVQAALAAPIGSATLRDALARRRPGDVVIVVSDITRPIPYADFLPGILRAIEAQGVDRREILLLVATGNHRPSTPAERRAMFGPDVAATCRIEDHVSESDDLVPCPGPSASGQTVRLNRAYMHAGFRLITGLVEPHFMAGFSGGRKAVCPGLAALESVRAFHGWRFLSDPRAENGRLEGNPLHEEAISVLRQAPADFALSVVLNSDRRVVRALAGDTEASHLAACDVVRGAACPTVAEPADIVVTSSGGYPLDATFYQCVKGFVSCLPAVRPNGTLLAFGGCREGVGSPEYTALLRRYHGRLRTFLHDIRTPGVFTKDQWQVQMHARALERVGPGRLFFVATGLSTEALRDLSVEGTGANPETVQAAIQRRFDDAMAQHPGATCALLPEGPYCAPLPLP